MSSIEQLAVEHFARDSAQWRTDRRRLHVSRRGGGGADVAARPPTQALAAGGIPRAGDGGRAAPAARLVPAPDQRGAPDDLSQRPGVAPRAGDHLPEPLLQARGVLKQALTAHLRRGRSTRRTRARTPTARRLLTALTNSLCPDQANSGLVPVVTTGPRPVMDRSGGYAERLTTLEADVLKFARPGQLDPIRELALEKVDRFVLNFVVLNG
ncbi:MAG: hypothetical protein ACYCZZ_03090 [Minisyncoccota bacterium]